MNDVVHFIHSSRCRYARARSLAIQSVVVINNAAYCQLKSLSSVVTQNGRHICSELKHVLHLLDLFRICLQQAVQ